MIATNREDGGRLVRLAWIKWAKTQPSPKPSWLAPWEKLSEPDKEADRQIWDAIAGPYLASTHTPVYCTISDVPGQGANRWLARILVLGQEPFDFVPDPHAYISFKGDLVLAINKAYPGVVYVSEETFKWASESSSKITEA